jgi:YHS domain-containing protein
MTTRNTFKLFVLVALIGIIAYGVNTMIVAQEEKPAEAAAPVAAPATEPAAVPAVEPAVAPVAPATDAAVAPAAEKPVVVDIANEVCPFMDKPVDPKVYTIFEGKLYHFCCTDCVAEFKKDPKAGVAKFKEGPADKQKKLEISEETKCACGKDINKDFAVVVGDKVVYACSEECAKKLAEPPAPAEGTPAPAPAPEAPKTE